MKRLRDDERGMVIVTAVMLLLIMVAIGLAVLSQVDTQTTQSRKERERESSFNLAEAALSAQTFVLGRRGTGTASSPTRRAAPRLRAATSTARRALS